MMNIGCILMASGVSARYGRNKLLEEIDGRAVILHAADSLIGAGLAPLAVTRSEEVRELMAREGIACVLHDRPKKSDTIHIGLENLAPGRAGFLFMPGDQPLVRPESLKRMAGQFFSCPGHAVRLGSGGTAGSPVLFPAFCREKLLAYEGERGGLDVLNKERIPCDVVQAAYAWELWDADTPEKMERIRQIYESRMKE